MRKKTVYVILIAFGALVLVLSIVLGALAVAFLGLGNGLVAELLAQAGEQKVPEQSSGQDWQTESPTEFIEKPTDWHPPVQTDPPVQTEPDVKNPTSIADFAEVFRLDGEDMEDWEKVYVAKKFVYDSTNLHLVQGEFEQTDGFVMYMAVDADNLYFGFDVNDFTVVDSAKDTYSGDHFTIAFDLGELCQWGQTYPMPVQYSFGKVSGGAFCMTADRQTGEDAVRTTVFNWRNDGTSGGVRVKNVISGSDILKSGWKAECMISWDVLIGYVCECYEVQSLEQLGLTREKLYASMCITYVDVSKDGSVNKIYRTDKERFLFLPQELEIEWLETAEITD